MKKLIYLLLIAVITNLSGELKLPSIFSDKMLLQREKQVRIWGKGDADASVTVSFSQQKKETIVKDDGSWQVTLDAMQANAKPQMMTISSGSESRTINNILVGDVWLYSGQSNMEFPLFKSTHAEESLKYPANEQLRFFKQKFTGTPKPVFDVVGGHWNVDSPNTRKWMSAVAYYFIQDIYEKEQVPVALMHACIGGSSAQMWTPLEDLKQVENSVWYIKNYEKGVANYESNKKEYEAKIAAGEKLKITDHYGWFSTATYNAMLHPIQNFTTKGVIWYQGEANTDSFSVKIYHKLFSKMIQSWRREMQDPELPFLFVQLPRFKAGNERFWPLHREAQLLTSEKLDHTYMAVTFDTGDENDIHPALKKPVGERLAKIALNKVYGYDVEYTAPTYKSAKVVGNTIELSFDNLGAGFKTSDGEAPKEFMICGADKKFVPAYAEIIGDKIAVSSESISEPVAVRYGWKNYLEVNLFGENGLPVGPFRTDLGEG